MPRWCPCGISDEILNSRDFQPELVFLFKPTIKWKLYCRIGHFNQNITIIKYNLDLFSSKYRKKCTLNYAPLSMRENKIIYFLNISLHGIIHWNIWSRKKHNLKCFIFICIDEHAQSFIVRYVRLPQSNESIRTRRLYFITCFSTPQHSHSPLIKQSKDTSIITL